jgi:hypothetical protein
VRKKTNPQRVSKIHMTGLISISCSSCDVARSRFSKGSCRSWSHEDTYISHPGRIPEKVDANFPSLECRVSSVQGGVDEK